MATHTEPLIRFRCPCGAVLAARASLAGRKGRCQRCGQTSVIPDRATVQADAAKDAVAVQEICGVCQTPLEADDDRTQCDECGLPFHQECWEENLGCAAYGCKNVNALKQGPDIRIGPLAGAAASAWQRPAWARQPAAPPPPDEDEFPWDFVLLGASGLAAPLSVVTCGFPSAAVAIAMTARAFTRQGDVHIAAAVACIAVSALATLGGFLISALFYLV